MGPPFVGKSYWAKKISKELNAECVDLDHVIEEFAAKAVSYTHLTLPTSPHV